MRLCGHFGPPQYTTISAFLGKFVLRTSFPTLSRGTRRDPAMFSPLNHSSVRTFQNLKERLLSRSCRTSWVEMVFTATSVVAVGLLMFAAPCVVYTTTVVITIKRDKN